MSGGQAKLVLKCNDFALHGYKQMMFGPGVLTTSQGGVWRQEKGILYKQLAFSLVFRLRKDWFQFRTQSVIRIDGQLVGGWYLSAVLTRGWMFG